MSLPLPILRGTNAPLLQRRAYTYSQSRGPQMRDEWLSLDPETLIAKWNQQYLLATESEMEIAQGVGKATFQYGGFPGGGGAANSLALSSDRWDLPGEVEAMDLWYHPAAWYLLWTLSGYSSGGALETKVTDYAAKLRSFGSHSPPVPVLDSTDAQGVTIPGVFNEDNFPGWTAYQAAKPLLAAQLMRFYGLVARGTTSYDHQRYVLRHTTTAPNYWSRNVADINVNCTYTPAQLLSEIGNVNLWQIICPARLAYKINAVSTTLNPVLFYGPRSDYLWGWRKKPSSEGTAGNGQIQITQEYSLDWWSLDLYSPAT